MDKTTFIVCTAFGVAALGIILYTSLRGTSSARSSIDIDFDRQKYDELKRRY